MPAMPLPEGEWDLQPAPLPTFKKTWPQAQAEIGAQWQKDRFFDPGRRQQMELALQQRERMQAQGQMQQRPDRGAGQRRQVMIDQLMNQRADRELVEMEPSSPYMHSPAAIAGLMGAGVMGSPLQPVFRDDELIKASGGSLDQAMLDYIWEIEALKGEDSLSDEDWELYQNITGERDLAKEAVLNNWNETGDR